MTRRSSPQTQQSLLERIWQHGIAASATVRYGSATVLALAASMLRITMNSIWGGDFPFIFYFPVTLFTALYGGFGPACVSLVLTGIATNIWVLAPIGSFAVTGANAQGTVVYLLVDVMIAWIGSRHRRVLNERRKAEEDKVLEAQAMRRLLELANHCLRVGHDFDKCLSEILDTAIELTGANKGNVQIVDPSTGALRVAAQRGFDNSFLDFFSSVYPQSSCACATAVRTSQRVLVEDVTKSEIFAGQPSLEVLLQAGVRAVQSNPLMSSAGTLLGMISTHWIEPHRFNERELRFMESLARDAADYLERKRAEEILRDQHEQLELALTHAREAGEARDRLMANVSHELRTPLTPVLMTVSILQQDQTLSPAVREALETINRNIQLEAKMVNDLLEIARVVNRRLTVELTECDLHDIIERALRICLPAANGKNLKFVTALQSTRHRIRGDDTRLQQLFWNLIQNAIKFTPDNGSITIHSRDTNAGVCVDVSDTGCGIEPGKLEKIFEPFERGTGSTLGDGRSGLGVGLAIARHVALAHGGTLTAVSDGLNRGSRFILSLPTAD